MKWGRAILFIISLPSVVTGYLFIGAAMLFGFAHRLRYEPGLVPTVEWRPWFDKIYQYSLTVGRGIAYKPQWRDDAEFIDSRLERHERKHIWQQEDNCAMSFLLGLAIGLLFGEWIIGLIIWASGVVWLSVNFITAGFRFSDFTIEGMYRNAEHERSAYAQTDLIRYLGRSWEELRLEVRRRRPGR